MLIRFFKRFLFVLLFVLLSIMVFSRFFRSIFTSNIIIFPYSITPFNIAEKYPLIWIQIKKFYIIFFLVSVIILSNFIYSNCLKNLTFNPQKLNLYCNNCFNLLIGYNSDNKPVLLPLSSLYQNICITGTIGTGKTSSAMYPFTQQLISYQNHSRTEKFGMLILDVKGNYYNQVLEFAKKFNRIDDIIEISLNSKIKYNPLDKPHLKPSILANRLKTILTLFSKNNSESYWLDKSEQIMLEAIKLCRLYNNNYVTFEELHKLINNQNYYLEKINVLKKLFFSGIFNQEQIYDLLSSIDFFEKEFFNLDHRTISILKSEITRITNPFVSDYQTVNTFSAPKEDLTFHGFSDVLNKGKIVVLNMNIAEYKNLSKIIATYLKLDFQTDIISRLTSPSLDHNRPIVFISDEFHEYVTSTDADFFALSRESKCINIIATQSYTSIVNSLENQYAAKVIIQNLINKLWFRTDDSYTIEEVQKQIGKEEKTKTSKSISESSKESYYNYFTKKFNSLDSNLSETFNTYTQNEYIYDTNFFTQHLETFSCLAFLSSGNSISKPEKLNLIPYFNNNTKNRKDDFMQSKSKIIKFILFIFILTFIYIFSSPLLSHAAYTTLVKKLSDAFIKINGYLKSLATPVAATAIATGLFIKKFSFGDEERIRLGKRLIRTTLFSYAFLLCTDLILSTIFLLLS